MHITAAAFAGIQIDDKQATAPVNASNSPLNNADIVRDMSVRAQTVQWQARREAA